MSEPAGDRLVNVESLLMHLQQDFEHLSQVVWQQQAELETLRKELARLSERLPVKGDDGEIRDPLAEKPPHY